MKRIFLLLTLIFASINLFSQSASIDDILNFRLKDTGSMYDQNNDVDGYYFFYEVDKLKKGDREFMIRILDKNLNLIAAKTLVANKSSTLISSSFNNKEIAFIFLNIKEKTLRFLTYNNKGEINSDETKEISRKEMNWYIQMASMGFTEVLFPIENKGFITSTTTDTKGIGYDLNYFSSNKGESSWNYSTPENDSQVYSFVALQSNDKFIVGYELNRKSKFSTKLEMSLVVYEIATGKQIAKKLYSREKNPRLITNSFINEDGSIVILGEFFKDKDDIFKDKSQGLFVEVINEKGEVLKDKTISWTGELFKKLKEANDDAKNNSLVYFHDIVKSKSGEYFAIGEMYRRTVSAAGVVGAALGGGNNITQLTITDAVIYTFDKDFNLKDLNVTKKSKSRAPSITDFGSPQLNAHVLKAYGAFDFVNVQNDVNNNRFYANFIDFERLENETDKFAFLSVINNDGKFSSDKIQMQRKRKYVLLALPAKMGHVLMIEYNKKEKILEMHLEKLNIK